MSSRIKRVLDELRGRKEKALITYITCGDPSLEKSVDMVLAMEEAGADIIELGVPYSDPLADGPVIQRAAQRALTSGANIDKIFDMVEIVRGKTQVPLVFLVYYNTIYNYQTERFINDCLRVGIDGLIIPDLPLEERKELLKAMKHYPIDLIPLVTPTSKYRIKQIVKGAKGFIYCVSSKGITGQRNSFDKDLASFICEVRAETDVPLAIGFGISTKEAVKELKGLCDGLIVGSAIVERVERGTESGHSVALVKEFVKELHEGIEL